MSYRRLSPILQPKSPVRLPPLLLSILMVFALLAAGLPSPTGAAGTGEAPPREAAPDRASPISDETGAEIRVADFAGPAGTDQFLGHLVRPLHCRAAGVVTRRCRACR
jgi:hypothetical protein